MRYLCQTSKQETGKHVTEMMIYDWLLVNEYLSFSYFILITATFAENSPSVSFSVMLIFVARNFLSDTLRSEKWTPGFCRGGFMSLELSGTCVVQLRL